MDLHPVLLGGGPFVVEEALRLAAGVPAAAGCPAGGLTRLPEEACNPDILLSVHNSASPTPEQPTANLFTPSGQTCCGPITQAYSICAMLPTPARLSCVHAVITGPLTIASQINCYVAHHNPPSL